MGTFPLVGPRAKRIKKIYPQLVKYQRSRSMLALNENVHCSQEATEASNGKVPKYLNVKRLSYLSSICS